MPPRISLLIFRVTSIEIKRIGAMDGGAYPSTRSCRVILSSSFYFDESLIVVWFLTRFENGLQYVHSDTAICFKRTRHVVLCSLTGVTSIIIGVSLLDTATATLWAW